MLKIKQDSVPPTKKTAQT